MKLHLELMGDFEACRSHASRPQQPRQRSNFLSSSQPRDVLDRAVTPNDFQAHGRKRGAAATRAAGRSTDSRGDEAAVQLIHQ